MTGGVDEASSVGNERQQRLDFITGAAGQWEGNVSPINIKK